MFGDVVSTTPERGLSLDPRAVRCRQNIREALNFWTRIVAAGRGHAVNPLMDVDTQADYLAHTRNRQWLAGQEFAARVAGELHELAWGEPLRVARPSGTRSRPLGQCPETGCDGHVRAILRPAEDERPSLAACTGGHEWPVHEWSRRWPAVAPMPLVDMSVAVLVLQVSADSVRQLVAQGRLARYGAHRALFMLSDLDELRDELWPISTG